MRDERRPGTIRYRRSTCGCGIRAQARAARVPTEMVQLVTGAGHFDATNDLPVRRGSVVEIDNRHLVVAPACGIEARDVGQRFRWRACCEARRGIESRIGCPGCHTDLQRFIGVRWPCCLGQSISLAAHNAHHQSAALFPNFPLLVCQGEYVRPRIRVGTVMRVPRGRCADNCIRSPDWH